MSVSFDLLSSFAPVPAPYRGVWRRRQLRVGPMTQAQPVVDDTSWVHWLQTSVWHADLRVPAGPVIGRDRCAQQGFAGVTQVQALPQGEQCTWHRRIDFQPPGAHADVGWMRFETPDRLIEVGALQDYDEIWERLPESTGHYRVLAECGADGEHVVGLWLLAGIWLMHVQPTLQPWPDDLQAGDDLAALVGRHPRQADAWLSTDISFGRWQDGLWTIERSTQVHLEGQQFVCAMRRDGPDAAALALAGTWRQARVLEWTEPPAT